MCYAAMEQETQEAASPPGDVAFSTKSLSVRAQKKILGKMASRNVAKHFITDTSARVLDLTYRVLKDFYSKKEAEMVVKNIIKMVIKLGVLVRNNQLNADEMANLQKFQKKFQTVIMTVVSFKQVAFSYDRLFLTRLLEDCQQMICQLIRPHLSAKSTQRVNAIFCHICAPALLDVLFCPGGCYDETMEKICQELVALIDEEL